ncbi:hypothetical protein IJ556_05480, partial [bacterium]|nr:hypothetical protein [bacterium]
LTNGYLSADSLIEIVINDTDYKNEIVLTIEDSNSFKYSYSHYDATSNCFRIIKYENSDYSTFYRFQSLRN